MLDWILADDFVHVVPQGMISKQEHIAFVRAHPHAFPSERRFAKLDVRVYGNVAIANGIVLGLPCGARHGARFSLTCLRSEMAAGRL